MKLLFILFYFVFSMAEKSLQRLDPHGDKNLKMAPACTVCHIEKKGKITLKGKPEESCIGCHNKSPHSGAPEHAKVSCLDCHTPHRAEARAWETPTKFLNHNTAGKHKPDAMIKKTCSECHKW